MSARSAAALGLPWPPGDAAPQPNEGCPGLRAGWALLVHALLCFFELPGWCARNESCSASLEHGQLTGIWNSGRPP